MLSKRHSILASIVLFWAQPHAALADEPGAVAQPVSNSVSDLALKQTPDNGWLLDFDYSFTGEAQCALRIELTPKEGTGTSFTNTLTPHSPPLPGLHHVSVPLEYPGEGTSSEVVVMILAISSGRVLAYQHLDQIIKWPAREDKDLEIAHDLIDNGRQDALREARSMLERLISRNPKLDAAYIELARVAMGTNQGPEGLHQAETLLDSALQVRPGSADAKILLGYVYAHQRRFADAESLFAEAARSNPPNAWLWTNWGELLDMQGKTDLAVAKYREAIVPERIRGNYRAREAAYRYLVKAFQARDDADGLEALYRQRITEFGPGSCFSADYAHFKLNVRRDAQGAIDLARRALDLNCEDSPSRQILGLASYAKWAESSGAASADALNQARVFLPAGPMTLYLLARSDSTMSAARKLIAAGEAIDQKDNEQMTALAHALATDELDAAERLLSLGARADITVGPDALPVALFPVLEGNVDAIRVLQKAGVDYSEIRYRGVTALDYAKQIGDDALLKALRADGQTL